MTASFSPDELLFSLPKICEEIPGAGPVPARDGQVVFRLHEDDWRQIEFVSVVVFYGQASSGLIGLFGIALGFRVADLSVDARRRLQELMQEADLLLVDSCRLAAYDHITIGKALE